MSEAAAIPVNCIQANPDIAGIGIRASIYIQNIWSLGITIWIRRHGEAEQSRRRLISAQQALNLFTTGALFSSAFIQATTYGLSAYHAILVLSLGWVNFASLLLTGHVVTASQVLNSPSHSFGDSSVSSPPPSFAFKLFRLFYSIASLIIFQAFGLWFWATVDTFGSTTQCALRLPIPIHILGHTFLSNSPATRIAFLATYSFFFLWLLYTIFFLVIPKLVREGFKTVESNGDTSRKPASQIIIIGIHVGMLVGIIVGVESMVRDAASFVQPGESEWTYGQTISIFLLVPGILETLQALAESRKQSKGRDTKELG